MKYKFLKNENWFKHDFRSREDKKLIRLKIKWKSAAPIGIFWQLCEMIYENAGMLDYDLDVIAFNCGDTIELVEDVINNCFIVTDDNKLTHETIIEQLNNREENYNNMVVNKSKAGKASAESRRIKKLSEQTTNNSSTGVEQMINKPQQNSTRDQSREIREESKELRDKNKLLAVYASEEIPTIQNTIPDNFDEIPSEYITYEMIDRLFDRFCAIDNRFKLHSVMTEINDEFGGFENLLNLRFNTSDITDESAKQNYRNRLQEYKRGIFVNN